MDASVLSSPLHICTYQGWADRDMARLSQGEGLGIFRGLVLVCELKQVSQAARTRATGLALEYARGRALFPRTPMGQSVCLVLNVHHEIHGKAGCRALGARSTGGLLAWIGLDMASPPAFLWQLVTAAPSQVRSPGTLLGGSQRLLSSLWWLWVWG